MHLLKHSKVQGGSLLREVGQGAAEAGAADARRHAAATLCHLVASSESAKAALAQGAVGPLVTMLVYPCLLYTSPSPRD